MKRGFTLVELLIVMAILSSLVGLVAGGFRSSQMRGRDAQRKSDLKQIANALELLNSDHGAYPDDSSGAIKACPYDPLDDAATKNCTWGAGEMKDPKTLYLKNVPQDPAAGNSYFYRVVPSASNQKFQLFARLENTKDADILTDISYLCGAQVCNFAVTSSNTGYAE